MSFVAYSVFHNICIIILFVIMMDTLAYTITPIY